MTPLYTRKELFKMPNYEILRKMKRQK
jgi:hypothetical protein